MKVFPRHVDYARRALVALLATALAGACTPQAQMAAAGMSPGSAAIAMPDAYAAEVASTILERGGNAVDAAVAAAFTLAVTYPEAGNIGGGGFMLAFVDGQSTFLDYREVAPAAASQDMYLDQRGNVIDGLSLTGHLAAGVPGTVAGLWEAHRRHGRLRWRELVDPALTLAADGFIPASSLQQNIAEEAPRLAATNFNRYYGGLRAGERFRQPELAAVLRDIAHHGPAGFYQGRTANLIVAELNRGGGIVTLADLAAYRPVWRTPLRVAWRDREVLTAPPPSSGGVALLQLLKLKDLRAADFAGLPHNSPQYIHLVAEISKRVFADRAEYFGDPDHVTVPVAQLIDPAYLAGRAGEVSPVVISTLDEVRPGLEGRHTTHFSIVDRWGNAVANTYTLNTSFGSGVVVRGGGFLLNNEMDDFSAKAGVPNYYGVTGSEANAVAPGKRMLSSMTPTILLKDGTVDMVLGSPGGSTIITSVFQGIVNQLDFGMSPQEAVAATRFHHQLLPPDLVTYSVARPLGAEVVEALRQRGYRAQPHEWDFGDLQLISRHGEGWQAASDPRGRGESRVLH